MNIWLKKIDINDGEKYYDVINTLSSYDNVFAKPMPEPFIEYGEFENFKKTRIKMENGIEKNNIYPTITYWVMLQNEPIGYAILRKKVDEDKVGGNIGICLLKEYQAKDLGSQVIEQLSLIALDEYEIEKVIFTVKEANIPCQKLMEKNNIEKIKELDGYYYYEDNLIKRFRKEEKIYDRY